MLNNLSKAHFLETKLDFKRCGFDLNKFMNLSVEPELNLD
jgi:hypothetical protein